MQRLDVSDAVRLIYKSLGVKGLMKGCKRCAHAQGSCANAHARQTLRDLNVVWSLKSVQSKRKLILVDIFSQNSDFQACSCSGVVSSRRDGLSSLVWHAWMRKGLTNSVVQNFVISQWLLVESRNSPRFMITGGSKTDTYSYFCIDPN